MLVSFNLISRAYFKNKSLIIPTTNDQPTSHISTPRDHLLLGVPIYNYKAITLILPVRSQLNFEGWMVRPAVSVGNCLEICHLDLTHKTNTRWQLPLMVTYIFRMVRIVTHQPKDGHSPEGSVLQTWNLALKLNQTHKTKAG